ncbi:MAG: FHA domain-containing protein, partial [Anaerolineales bacterium]
RQLFVINTNEAMGRRDPSGRTRFTYARDALLNWWTQPEASQFAADDLSLVTGTGPIVEHSSSSATLASALNQFEPTFSPAEVDFDLLLESMSYLEDERGSLDLPSYILFFTTPIGVDQELALTNTIARAQEIGVSIFPILVNPPAELEEDALDSLNQLAESTGGRLVTIGPENPDLADLQRQILSQRTQYRITYISGVSQSGTHQIQLQVTSTGLIAESESRDFQLTVLPPEVTFIQPPLEIERSSEDPSVPLELIPPTEHPIEILVTFPDDHPRALVNSTLMVNGQESSQRTGPPFDQFAWDLSGYAQDQTVELSVTVMDSLGLEGTTAPHTVQLLVEPPPSGLAALRPALAPLAMIVGILVVATIGAMLLINLSQRPITRTEPEQPAAPAVQPLQRARLQDPTSQGAEAFLVPLTPNGQEGKPIPLTGVDITLGADASLSAYPFRDDSVSGLHARLIRQAGGDYLLRDQGSIAGTWVNFEQVPKDGVRLKHGDQIRLGRIGLRFVLPKAGARAETRIERIDANTSKEAKKPLDEEIP